MTRPPSDVVVVGSGAAGMVAALRVAVAGATVTVLECAEQFGGTSALSGGGMWLPRSAVARAAGVEDSRDAVKRYLMRLTMGSVAERVIDRFVDTAPKVADLILEHTPLSLYADVERPDYQTGLPGAVDFGRLVGVELYDLNRLGALRPLLRQPDWEARVNRLEQGGTGMEPITHYEMQAFVERGDPKGWVPLARERIAKGVVTRGCALIAGLLEAALARGVRLVNYARVRELIIGDGRVTGVEAEVRGVHETFQADAGVVLASGGFEWNRALWDGLVRVPGVEPLSPPTNRGDALRMAEKVGARLAFLDQVWWLVNAGGQPGQLVVNRAGRRFVNECLNYNDYGKVLAAFDPHTYEFPNLPAYVISNRPLTLVDTDPNLLGDRVANADAASASTLRELGTRIGVDADGLEATVEEFDRHAAHGEDPAFHRGEIAWDRWRRVDRTLKNPALAPIGPGPYYAQRVVLRCFGTKGGPVIDDHARILDFDGAPIPGLCGAGNAIASPFGLAYPGGGGTLGPATTFGYVAGATLTS